MSKKIIGFAGRARNGKSELAHILKEERGATVLTIASYLKKLCGILLKLDAETMNEYKNNNTIINVHPDDTWAYTITAFTGINNETILEELKKYPVIKTVREALQVIGTNIIRKYYPDWHIDMLLKDYHNLPEDTIVVIDDVRFPNELEKIKKEMGEVFFVMRPTMFFQSSNHLSETALSWRDMKDGDHIIINDYSLDRLKTDILWYFDNRIISYDTVADRDTKIFASDRGLFSMQFFEAYNYYDSSKLPEETKKKLKGIINSDTTKSLSTTGLPTFLCADDDVRETIITTMLEFREKSIHNCMVYKLGDEETINNPFIVEELKLYVEN